MPQIPLTPARRALTIIGGLIVAATWLYLVFVRPTDWSAVGGSAALPLIAVLFAAVVNIRIYEWSRPCTLFVYVFGIALQLLPQDTCGVQTVRDAH